MDRTDVYIEMCRQAYELQHMKYRIGFTEGDTIFCGTITRTIGHDFLQIKKVPNEFDIFQFAMIEPSEVACSFGTEDLPEQIDIKYGRYVAEYLRRPIWLPHQDQLQDMVVNLWGASIEKPGIGLQTIFNLRINESEKLVNYYWKFDSMEQLWLAFVMYEKYSKQWNGNEWIDK